MTDKKNTFEFLDTDVFIKKQKDREVFIRGLNKKFKVPHVDCLSSQTFSIVAGLQKELSDAAADEDMKKVIDTTIKIVYLALSQKNKITEEEVAKIPHNENQGMLAWILTPSESGEPFLEEGHGVQKEAKK